MIKLERFEGEPHARPPLPLSSERVWLYKCQTLKLNFGNLSRLLRLIPSSGVEQDQTFNSVSFWFVFSLVVKMTGNFNAALNKVVLER